MGVARVTIFPIPSQGLLTAYLGGATATHVRVDEPYFMPIIMGVVLWIAYGLRRPDVFALAVGAPPGNPVHDNG